MLWSSRKSTTTATRNETLRKTENHDIVGADEGEYITPTLSRHTKRKISSIITYTHDVEKLNDIRCRQMKNKLEKESEVLHTKCSNFMSVTAQVAEEKIRVRLSEIESEKEKEISALKEQHKIEMVKLQRSRRYYKDKNEDIMAKMADNDLNFFINHALKGKHFKTRAATVLDLVVSGELFGEEASKKATTKFVRKEVRKTFTAWRLCMAKDTAHQGCLNLQGIEAVRRVEELEEREQGMIPSKSSVWREGDELLRKVGYPLFKIKHRDTELGEVVELDFECVFRFALETKGMTELAQRESVEMAFSVDAAELSSGTSHIFAALKLVDLRSRNRNGELMFVKEIDGEVQYTNIQSNKNVFIMMMVYAKDKKKTYRHFFNNWFDFINKIKLEGLPYRNERNKAIKPIKVRIPQDTSSLQKALNLGGACKACNMFCHMCGCQSYGGNCQLMRWREGPHRCRFYCLSQRDPPKKCFHWNVDNDHEIARKKQEIFVILMLDEIRSFRLKPTCFNSNRLSASGIKIHYSVNEIFLDRHVEEDPVVQAGSQILTSVTDATRFSDPKHINFLCPTSPCAIRTAYNSLLDRELIIRKLFGYISTSVEIKQKYLLLSIRNGEVVKDNRRAIARWSPVGKNDKMMDVNDAVLCILHLELRCSENKLAHLLNEGFTHRNTKALVDTYMTEVEKIVNEGKIGRSTHQNQWTFPINKGNDGVASDFSLKGEFGKNILLKGERIANVALRYHTQQEKDDFNTVLKKYQEVLCFLNRRTEFKESDVREFQSLADDYGQKWMNVTGRDGQTNYEHFILTSHVSHYLLQDGNLYRFSQQGFEAMMSKIKCIYHRCTSRGGHGSHIRSHILQICHFLVRSMLWNSGHGEAYFHAKYPKSAKEDNDHNDLFID